MSLLLDLHNTMAKNNLKLSIAESCTGGLISSMIVAMPGASVWFAGGVIVYSIESKMKLLGISQDDILQHGAVSHAICKQMAEKTRHHLSTDIGISITGNAGPTAEKNSTTGIAYIGFSIRNHLDVKQVECKDNRLLAQDYFAQQCINLIVQNLNDRGAHR